MLSAALNGPSASGGIGRRAGFRFQCLRTWGFKSPLAHAIRDTGRSRHRLLPGVRMARRYRAPLAMSSHDHLHQLFPRTASSPGAALRGCDRLAAFAVTPLAEWMPVVSNLNSGCEPRSVLIQWAPK